MCLPTLDLKPIRSQIKGKHSASKEFCNLGQKKNKKNLQNSALSRTTSWVSNTILKFKKTKNIQEMSGQTDGPIKRSYFIGPFW